VAFSGINSGGGRGRGRGRAAANLSEMNVVPLVDVVLVLLIIFMVTASAMEFGLEIDVPAVKQSARSLENAPVVSIGKSGTVFLSDKPTNLNVLAAEVLRQKSPSKDVYVRADRSVRWDQIAQVISALGVAKLNVKMVTKTEDIRK
jgi:biopolymer transport protein ExbD